MKRSIVLVGLSGSGKTSVAQAVAERLDAHAVDLDRVVEADAGRTIAQIFRDTGETAFRELERAAMDRAVERDACIIAAGGGWAAEEGNTERIRGRACIIWLRVAPAEAARRLRRARDRPLLRGGDVEERLQSQLEVRTPRYRSAEAACETDGKTVAEVTEAVVELAQRLAGW